MQMENIDKTIDCICECIQSEVCRNACAIQNNKLPEWINALAALVTARGNAEMTEFKV